MSVTVHHIDHPKGCPCCRQSAGAARRLSPLKKVGVSVRERVWEKRASTALARAQSTPPASGLDTFAQVGTEASPEAPATQVKALTKRARGKYLTQNLTLGLVDVERRRIEAGEAAPLRSRQYKGTDNRGLLQGYWRAYHCGSELRNEGGKLVTTLCRCRWCTVCNKIETARLIKKYKPVLDSWEEKYMVTLTVPNVQAERLPAEIQRMKMVFNRIREMIKKQYQRGQRARPLEALRKLETTVNLQRWDFHPHFHLITNSREVADLLVDEWLRHIPEADRKGQDVRVADENSVLELFKYFAKLTASGGKAGGKKYISAEALNIIFNAVAGERVFQAFNIKAAPVPQKEVADLEELPIDRGERWLWNPEVTDWVEHATGELLTNYKPAQELRDLVERRILRTKHRPRPAPPPPSPGTG